MKKSILVIIVFIISACSSQSLSAEEPQAQLPVETSTQASMPPPQIQSVTITPTEDPVLEYYDVYGQVLHMLNTSFPLRGPGNNFESTPNIAFKEQEDGRVLIDANFVSEGWHIRLFDWNFQDQSDVMDVSVWNPETHFVWRGHAGSGELFGWLTSGGLIPEIPDSARSDGWYTYVNNQYGYRFNFPPEADVFEFGVESYDLRDVPAGMTNDEYKEYLYQKLGPNICVQLVLGDGYIRIEAPENQDGNYTFCRYRGPGAPGWSSPERQEDIEIGDQVFTFTGRELIKNDGTGNDHDEALAFELPSGVRIEIGAYSDTDGGYDRYRVEVLPILISILNTYETIP